VAESVDAVVIGAGPAGLSAAEKLAEEGFHVIVLEKEAKPNYEKLCGGYVPASVFELFSIPEAIADYSVKGVKIVASSGEWTIEFDEVVGYNVDRTKFAEYLARRVEKAGGEVLTNTMALKVEQDDKGVTVVCRDQCFRAKMVVAADGVYSRVGGMIRGGFSAEELGLAIQVKSSLSKSFAKSIGGLNVIFLGREFSPLGYAYAFPKRSHVDVGVGTLVARAREVDMEKYLDRVLSRCGLSRVSKARYAAVPLTGPLLNIVDRRILLAGDSAGHVAPLIGEGIKFALTAGRLAAESIVEYLNNRISLCGVEKFYLCRLKKSFYGRLKLEKIVLKLFKKRKMSSSKFLRDPKMREIIAELYLDKREFQQLFLASLLRIPLVFLK